MCAMTPLERGAAQQLLNEVTESLKAFEAAKERVSDGKRNRLVRQAIVLRRQLADDSIAPPTCKAASAWRSDGTASTNADSTLAVSHDGQPSGRQPGFWRRWWARGSQLNDCALHPIVRLVISGVCLLAWTIKPGTTDPPLAISLLMFLRFVPIFTVGGSLYERAATGTAVGIGLFFALLGAESLSIPMWDARLAFPASRITAVWHAEHLASIIYVLGAVGLLLCAVVTRGLRRERHAAYQHYLRLSVLALVIVQLALVAELGYAGLRHAIDADQDGAGVFETFKSLHHSSPRRG